jgi:hypothetical protein
MRRKMALILLSMFVLAFTVGALIGVAYARPPCIATCINGTWMVCCPRAGGGWDCNWGGPCDWPGWIP